MVPRWLEFQASLWWTTRNALSFCSYISRYIPTCMLYTDQCLHLVGLVMWLAFGQWNKVVRQKTLEKCLQVEVVVFLYCTLGPETLFGDLACCEDRNEHPNLSWLWRPACQLSDTWVRPFWSIAPQLRKPDTGTTSCSQNHKSNKAVLFQELPPSLGGGYSLSPS